MDKFDPYQQWLGIPSQLRPLNHYILLGIRIYEADPNKISVAFNRRMKLLKKLQSGPRGELAKQLIAEVGKAKHDLIDPDRRAKYDSVLRKQLQDRQRQLDQAQDETLEAQSIATGQELPALSQPSTGETLPVIVTGAGNPELTVPKLVPKLKTAEALPSPTVQTSGQAGGRADDTARDQADADEEMLSPFWFLTDIRYLVGLLALTVVIMTATVKLLSPSEDQTGEASLSLSSESEVQPGQVATSATSSGNQMPALPKVQQAADNSVALPLERGHLEGKELKFESQSVTNWGAGDQALWLLEVSERRKGYFNCLITYRAKSECGFEVQLGNRKPRPFTIYPHEEDFEEEFIVRLDKAKANSSGQVFRLTALGAAGEVEIKRIVLQPNR